MEHSGEYTIKVNAICSETFSSIELGSCEPLKIKVGSYWP